MKRLAPALLVFAVACAKSNNFGDDSGAPDANVDDAAPPTDASTVVYSDMTKATNWTFFDTSSIDPNASGYFGAAFDGRYVYFSPVQGTAGVAIEYDTQQSFTTAKSWSTFVLGNDAGGANRFVGAVFDGRYVYAPPFAQATPNLARYDTQGSYTSGASWTTVDLASVAPAAGASFAGGVFAAKHVYFAPYGDATALAYDTTQDITTSAAWSSFDATFLLGASFYACSGATDGKYVYFAPYSTTAASSGLVLRYDTTALFTSTSAWTTFDATTLDARAAAYEGAVFDGRYLYFVPSGATFTSGFAIRYDTTAAFAQSPSWSSFDITTLAPVAGGFVGGAFDGRYVYYVPYGGSNGVSGIVARYDTLGAFADASAWQTIDLSSLNPNAEGYATAAFDGRYLYLSPNLAAGAPGHIIARFDAKTPPSRPITYAGSFF